MRQNFRQKSQKMSGALGSAVADGTGREALPPDDEIQRAIRHAQDAVRRLEHALKGDKLPLTTIQNDWQTGRGSTFKNIGKQDHLIAKQAGRYLESFRSLRRQPQSQYRLALNANRDKLDAVVLALEKVVRAAGGYVPLEYETSFEAFLPYTAALPRAPKGAIVPLPDLEDYQAGRVHASLAAEIRSRLYDKESALADIVELSGAASSGKTTTAFVVAFSFAASEGHECFYTDLGRTELLDQTIVEEFARIATRGARTLLIVDNANRRESLVAELVAKLQACSPSRPKMLIVRTPMAGVSTLTLPSSRVYDFDGLRTTIEAADLAQLARFYVAKFSGRDIDPPQPKAQEWVKSFGAHLHAFSFALMAGARRLGEHDNWELDPRDAHEWINDHWLHPGPHPPSSRAIENIKCFSAFAEQEFELAVPLDALPFPVLFDLKFFLDKGVLTRLDVGDRFQMVEPGWGNLLLGAMGVSPGEREEQMFDAASRSAPLATVFDTRLSQLGDYERRARLRQRLAAEPGFLDLVARSTSNVVSSWLRLGFMESGISEAMLRALRAGRIRPAHLPMGELAGLAALPFPGTRAAGEVKRLLSDEVLRRLDTSDEPSHEVRLSLMLFLYDHFRTHDIGRKVLILIEERLAANDQLLRGEKAPLIIHLLQSTEAASPKIRTEAWAELRARAEANPGYLDELTVNPAASLLVFAQRDGDEAFAERLRVVIDRFVTGGGTGRDRVVSLLEMGRFRDRSNDVALALAALLDSGGYPIDQVSLQQLVETNSLLERHDKHKAMEILKKALDRREKKHLIVDATHLGGGSIDYLFREFGDCNNFINNLTNSVRGQLGGLLDHYLEINIDEVCAFVWAIYRHIPDQRELLDSLLRGESEALANLMRRSAMDQLAHCALRRIPPINEVLVATLDQSEWDKRQAQSDQPTQLGGFLADVLTRGGASDFGGALAKFLAIRSNIADVGARVVGRPRTTVIMPSTLSQIYKIAACCPDKKIARTYLRRMNDLLRQAYRAGSFSELTSGIRSLGSLDPTIMGWIEWEWPWLFARMKHHLQIKDQAPDIAKERHFIQLLGAVSVLLDASRLESDLPAYIQRINRTSGMSALVLPHREAAIRVEFGQFGFWLGIRYLDLFGQERISIDEDSLRQTLALLPGNLANDTSPSNLLLDREMIAWLEAKLGKLR